MLTYEPLFAVLPSSGLCEITVPSVQKTLFLKTLPRFKPFCFKCCLCLFSAQTDYARTDTLSAAGIACALLSPYLADVDIYNIVFVKLCSAQRCLTNYISRWHIIRFFLNNRIVKLQVQEFPQ